MKIGSHKTNDLLFLQQLSAITISLLIFSIDLHFLKLIHMWSKSFDISLLVKNKWSFQFVYMWCNLIVCYLFSYMLSRTNTSPSNKLNKWVMYEWFTHDGKVKPKYNCFIYKGITIVHQHRMKGLFHLH
jgi:hypothetical protein